MTYHSLTRRILQLATLTAVGAFVNEHALSFQPPPVYSSLDTARENGGHPIASHGAQVSRSQSLHPASALPRNQRANLNRLATSINDLHIDLHPYFHSAN